MSYHADPKQWLENQLQTSQAKLEKAKAICDAQQDMYTTLESKLLDAKNLIESLKADRRAFSEETQKYRDQWLGDQNKIAELKAESEGWRCRAEINGKKGFEWQTKFEELQSRLASARGLLEKYSRGWDGGTNAKEWLADEEKGRGE